MAIKAIERINGCFARAEEKEPLFVLKSTDKLAPAVVRAWATAYRQKHIDAGTEGHKLAKVIEKHTDALDVADEMEAYRANLVATGELKD